MSFYRKIRALKLEDSTNVNLTWEEGCDVHHYTDDHVDMAVSNTGIAHTLAEVITDGPLYKNGNEILEEMRDEGLLDDYERGSEDFTSFVADVIESEHWNYGWLDYSTEKFDHKRGFTTFTLDFDVKAGDLKDHPHAFIGWTASVRTDNGTLTLD
tara:strand:- start:107 stop:571 length:465 start_codon:yes stop_codon:yes gene_type:complete